LIKAQRIDEAAFCLPVKNPPPQRAINRLAAEFIRPFLEPQLDFRRVPAF